MKALRPDSFYEAEFNLPPFSQNQVMHKHKLIFQKSLRGLGLPVKLG